VTIWVLLPIAAGTCRSCTGRSSDLITTDQHDHCMPVCQVAPRGSHPAFAGEGTLFYTLAPAGAAPDIPWSGDVYARGKELERGEWGAAAAGEAVLRTGLTTTLSNLAAVTVTNVR
jgi:hypothetical protein